MSNAFNWLDINGYVFGLRSDWNFVDVDNRPHIKHVRQYEIEFITCFENLSDSSLIIYSSMSNVYILEYIFRMAMEYSMTKLDVFFLYWIYSLLERMAVWYNNLLLTNDISITIIRSDLI